MIRLVTDSGSMLTADIRTRFAVDVVPMAVELDGQSYREGVDLDVADFFTRLAGGATVTTSAPSPGDLLSAYQRASDAGAAEVLSIHTGSNYSATVGAATVAAGMASLPVTVVDTRAASFAVSLSVWAAGESLAGGGTATRAAHAARTTAAQGGSVFVVGVPRLALEGGRFTAVAAGLAPTSVLELGPAGLRELGKVDSVEAALDAMTAHIVGLTARGPALRMAIGDADRPALADALTERLRAATGSHEIVHYVVGPSVAAHTGVGSIGIVYCPLVPIHD
ncbi:MAG: DegV family protein [Ilumatobacteraceae bacterium]